MITCETARVVARLTVDAEGGAKMNVSQGAAGAPRLHYYRLATAGDVTTCLDELTREVIPSR